MMGKHTTTVNFVWIVLPVYFNWLRVFSSQNRNFSRSRNNFSNTIGFSVWNKNINKRRWPIHIWVIAWMVYGISVANMIREITLQSVWFAFTLFFYCNNIKTKTRKWNKTILQQIYMVYDWEYVYSMLSFDF